MGKYEPMKNQRKGYTTNDRQALAEMRERQAEYDQSFNNRKKKERRLAKVKAKINKIRQEEINRVKGW